ncbi:MAG TPA: hypothetical protein DCM62_06845 [Bacteroidales bacterium]|nr:hypothetical protein [Bacteroidales bacterium]
MNRIFFSIALFSFLIFQSTNIKGQAAPVYGEVLGQRLNTITTAVPFLMIAPDSRAGGMGDAGVSSTPDANSLHWNAAKFAFIDQEMGFSLSYTPWLRALVPDINLSYLSGFRRIDDIQTVAFSLAYFTLGEINFTDEAGQVLFPVRPNEFAVSLAYARKLGEHFSGAVAARFIYSNLTQGQFVGGMETRPGMAVAADVSAFYTREVEFGRMPAIFSAGVNISNIGNKISYSDEINANFIPINLRMGPSLTFEIDDFNQFSVMVDLNKLLVPTPPIFQRDPNTGQLVIGADGEYVIEAGRNPNRTVASGIFGSFSDAPGGFREELNEITYSVGLEYVYDEQFAIRAGYFHEHETKGDRKFFTLGLGLKYNVFGLDFSYVVPLAQRSPLENVLRFSLKLNFDALGR